MDHSEESKHWLDYLKGIPQHEQRSEAWFEQRKDKLTSSDAATALGINPYSTGTDLLFKKCGMGKPFTGNVATLHGQKYEDEAIEFYSKAFGKINHEFGLIDYNAVPRPEEEGRFAFVAGSTDGIAEDIMGLEPLVLLEVKSPYRRKIVPGYCPEYYVPQVQLNMAILGLEKADFIEYVPKGHHGSKDYQLNVVRIHRDRDWFNKNVKILQSFWTEVEHYRKVGIETHPEYEKYSKKTLDLTVPKPPRGSLFVPQAGW